MIEVLSSAALATVQDLGRTGSLRWGVGTSGAMDNLALAAGNLLLGNALGAAAIEIPVFPFKVRFGEDCAFALTGADCAARLDGQPLLPWWVHQARAGQVLALGLPQGGAQRGSRAVLCVAGGIDVPEVLGSRSTQLRGAFGGHEGRALRRGDVLRAAATGSTRTAATPSRCSGSASAGGTRPKPVLHAAPAPAARSTSPRRSARPSWPPKAPRNCVLREPSTSGTSTPPARHSMARLPR